jgi:beta-mannosidase
MNYTFPLHWTVGHTPDLKMPPDTFVPATVPGAVQVDWAQAQNWEPFWKGSNVEHYRWMENVCWVYRSQLDLPEVPPDQTLFWILEGVDYHFEVRVNGVVLHEQEGMFTPVELDLTEWAGKTVTLEVGIHPPPMTPLREGEIPGTRAEANSTCKPAVSYGWDWHPRLIPSGIWKETRLELRDALHLNDLHVTPILDEGRKTGVIHAEIHPTDEEGSVVIRVLDPMGEVATERIEPLVGTFLSLALHVDQPHLWWSWDLGEPHLYTLVCELVDPQGSITDRREHRFGFRTVRLVMHEGQWERNTDIANTQALPPITLELNGVSLFARGSNWVPPDVFPGRITEETCRPLLEMAKNAHFNLLRSWGGAIVNKNSFFDLCDEMGLLVWQEFPLCCLDYPITDRYLTTLEQEARSILKQVRPHPCLAIWSGGNELFCSWSGMTMQHRAIRLLDSLCLELDPETPFLPTSPVMGMIHGNYTFRLWEDGRDIFQYSQDLDGTAFTEFGCSGPSPVEVIDSFMPEEERFPPEPGTSWDVHHGIGAWDGDPGSWLCLPALETYFGPCESLEELVAQGEWLQCEGYKAAYEEYRRRKPFVSMALNWDYNEPWPTAAGNNLVSWPHQPKPAYFAVREACRLQMVSARIPKFDWTPDETLTVELWLLNDTLESLQGPEVRVHIENDGKRLHSKTVSLPDAAENRHAQGPTVSFSLLEAVPGDLFLKLDTPDHPDLASGYRLLMRCG